MFGGLETELHTDAALDKLYRETIPALERTARWRTALAASQVTDSAMQTEQPRWRWVIRRLRWSRTAGAGRLTTELTT